MSKKLTQNEVIERFKNIHGDKYDYSLVEYIDNKTRIEIVCHIHGSFIQIPQVHFRGSGCKICGRTKANSKTRLTQNQAVDRLKKVHDGEYNYDKFTYTNAHTKSIIKCKKHGEFYQNFVNHSNGAGCPKCYGKFKKSRDKFIREALKRHNSIYSYNKFVYINNSTKGIITCKKHGDFLQSANHHLRGHQCPFCKRERQLENSKFNIDNVYVIILKNPNEEFIKIGTSFNLYNRFREFKKLKYNLEIIEVISNKNVLYTALFEKELLLRYDHYMPLKKFAGYTECLDISCRSKIQEDIQGLLKSNDGWKAYATQSPQIS